MAMNFLYTFQNIVCQIDYLAAATLPKPLFRLVVDLIPPRVYIHTHIYAHSSVIKYFSQSLNTYSLFLSLSLSDRSHNGNR